jgi:hypothetical protein
MMTGAQFVSADEAQADTDTDTDTQKPMAQDVTPDKGWPLCYSLWCHIQKKYNPNWVKVHKLRK